MTNIALVGNNSENFQNHLRFWLAQKNIKLVAILSSNFANSADELALLKIEIYHDLSKLLADHQVDLFDCCFLANDDRTLIKKLSRKKQSMIINAPAMSIPAEFAQILRTAKKTKQPLFITGSLRFMPIINRLKELVSNSALGEISSCSINSTSPDDKLYAMLDLALWLNGSIKKVVKTDAILLNHSNGKTTTINCELRNKNQQLTITISGSLGSITATINDTKQHLQLQLANINRTIPFATATPLDLELSWIILAMKDANFALHNPPNQHLECLQVLAEVN